MEGNQVLYPDFLFAMSWRFATVDEIIEKAHAGFSKNHPEIPGGLVGYTGMSLIEAKLELSYAPTELLEGLAKNYGGKTMHEALAELSYGRNNE